MEAVNKTNGNIYRIQQDTNGKWFGYCDRTKEYTPAFVKLKGLVLKPVMNLCIVKVF